MGTSVGARMGFAKLKSIGRSPEHKQRVSEEAAMRSTGVVARVISAPVSMCCCNSNR